MLKHVIFDCDGVLVDSEPLSMRADVELLRQHGVDMSEAEAHSLFVGKTFQAMLDLMERERGITFPPGLHAIKNRMVEDLYHAGLPAVTGVAEVLEKLKQRGLGLSIGSNSPKARVELAIRLTGIAHQFDRIISFEDVEHGKPSPDIFLLAAKRAGVEPANCLVVEDSLTGMTAAIAAGIPAIGFTGTHDHPDSHGRALLDLGAKAVIHHMPELLNHI